MGSNGWPEIGALQEGNTSQRVKDVYGMLDIIYILIGAAFLGGCVLYAVACDHL
jgi:hypothetical protein